MWLENMRFLDALYMTVITVSTVGFREVKDLSDIGKLWTIILIIFGWGTVSILITNVAAYFLSLEVFKRRYGMPKGISDHYIICGFGRMGRIVAEFLKSSHSPFIIVENDPERVEQAISMGYKVIEGDATEESTLIKACIHRARGLASLLRDDPDNLYVIINAKNLNPKIYTVAKATTEKGAKLMRNVGTDRVILPYDWAGIRIARALIHPAVSEFLDLYHMRVEEITLDEGSPFVGKSLRELNLTKYGAYVLAVFRNGKPIIPPNPHEPLNRGDVLIILGEIEKLKDVEVLVHGK